MYSKKFRLPIVKGVRGAKNVFSSPYFLLKARDNDVGHNRFGIIISSGSVKKSVKRHFLKRVIADEIKKWPDRRGAGQDATDIGRDFLVIVSPKIDEAALGEIRIALKSAGEKMSRTKNRE